MNKTHLVATVAALVIVLVISLVFSVAQVSLVKPMLITFGAYFGTLLTDTLYHKLKNS